MFSSHIFLSFESVQNYIVKVNNCDHKNTTLLSGIDEPIERCHMVKFRLWKFRLELNPVVTLGSSAIIWGLVIWCMVNPDEAKAQFSPWTTWITETWTWFYIGIYVAPKSKSKFLHVLRFTKPVAQYPLE